jgi:hypothetical protein
MSPPGPGAGEPAARRYAAARREALAAAELAGGPLGERSWNTVAATLGRANYELARCDDAWLELASAAVRMVAGRGDLSGLAPTWGPAVRAACRYRGPTSETVTRMRAAAAATALSGWQGRRVGGALRRLAAAERRAGPGAGPTRKRAWLLADRYARYLLRDELSAHLTRVVADHPDGPERAEAARRASRLCLDVADVESGRRFYQLSHRAELAELAGREDDVSRTRRAAGRQHLADYHLLNGEPARAEPLARAALEPLAGLLATAPDRPALATLEDLHDRCRGTLADCLLVTGHEADAHRAYAAAAEFALDHPGVDPDAARLHRNAAVYTGREWETSG